jgi:hypothetical protein
MNREQMSDKEAMATLHLGFDLLFNYAKLISMLPLEDWLELLERAESTAPILDPTLYREALYSGKLEAIKKVIRAALELKRTVEEVRADVLSGKVEP